MGLTLCKVFIDLSGGSLKICSEIGNGSIITVRIPVGLVQEKGAKELMPTASDY